MISIREFYDTFLKLTNVSQMLTEAVYLSITVTIEEL